MKVMIVASLILLVTLQSEFIKSRKRFDESNLIKDVRFYDWGGMSPASDYSYMDRW